MTLIYDIFIYPLEFFMQIVLEKALSVTGSPLFSLICLSLAVSLGSLPLYHIAESWQDKEREIQKKLRPKIDEFKAVFKGSALNSYINTLYRQNGYHPIFAVRTSFGLLIQIPFFFAAYHLLSNYTPFNGVETILFKDLGKPDAMISIAAFSINILPIVMTAVNLVSASIYGKKTTIRESAQLYGMALLFLVLLYNSSSALLFYWTCNNIFSLVKNIAYNKIYDLGIIKSEKKKDRQYNGTDNKIFYLSLLSFSLLAFVAAPLSVLSSGSEADFEEPLFHYAGYSLLFSVIFIFLLTLLYLNLPGKLKTLCSFGGFALLLWSLMNVFVFTGNYGDMSHFVFSDGIEIDVTDIYLNAASGFLIMIAVIFLFYKNKTDLINKLLKVILISLLIFCVNEADNFQNMRQNKSESKTGEYYFNFSKNGQNVVIIMLDRFIGGFMPELLELMPEINDNYDGFVYYKNSLSPASYTIGGVPAIMGGWEYTVRNVNTTRNDVPLMKKLDESVRIMPYNFNNAGFDVTIFANDISRWFLKDVRDYLGSSVFIEPDFPKYREKWLEMNYKKSRDNDNSIRKKLLAFGIFRASPLFLREFIYDDSNWHIDDSTPYLEEENDYKKDEKNFVYFHQKSKHRRDTTLKYYAVLDFLPEFSSVSKESKSQFIYMTNDLTHEPHMINRNFEFDISGKIGYPRKIHKKFNKNLSSLKHLYTGGAALRLVNDWLSWMKMNDVYDNTRIIIVSDHGRAIYDPYFKSQKIPGARKKGHPTDFDNLILVKDFNARGALKMHDEFMSSADVPAIAMKDIIEGINPYTGEKIKSPENKFPFYAYDIQWRTEKQDKFKFKIHEGYKIEKDDFNNPAKWSVVYE